MKRLENSDKKSQTWTKKKKNKNNYIKLNTCLQKKNTRIHKINLIKIPKTKLKKVTTQKP